MDTIEIRTDYYEQAHGAKPHHNKRGDWRVRPPRGSRDWLFQDMPFGEAVKQATDMATRNGGPGVYHLVP